MREIKFRAWDKGISSHYMVTDGKGFSLKELRKMDFRPEVIFMQYTGLKDKNGKEIYEGDIVNSKYFKRPFPVVFVNGYFSIQVSTDNIRILHGTIVSQDAEVIGNIYENPELLSDDISTSKTTPQKATELPQNETENG